MCVYEWAQCIKGLSTNRISLILCEAEWFAWFFSTRSVYYSASSVCYSAVRVVRWFHSYHIATVRRVNSLNGNSESNLPHTNKHWGEAKYESYLKIIRIDRLDKVCLCMQMRIARACLAFVHVNWHCQRSAATARRNSLFGHTFTYKQSTALVVRYFGPWAFGCVCDKTTRFERDGSMHFFFVVWLDAQ